MKFKIIKAFCGLKKGGLLDLPDNLSKPLIADKFIVKATDKDKAELEEEEEPAVETDTDTEKDK